MQPTVVRLRLQLRLPQRLRPPAADCTPFAVGFPVPGYEVQLREM
jgi:hypothetical protein